MKIELRGIHLLESTFRHARDAFGPISQPPTDQPAEVQIELAKGEAPHDYLITLHVRSNPQTQYAFEVKYAVIMKADPETETPPENLLQRIMTTGATIAFPYCRELVSNLTARGRFGIVWLNPMNFANAISQQFDAQKVADTK